MAFYEKYMHVTYIYIHISLFIDKNYSGCLNIKFYKSLSFYKLFFFQVYLRHRKYLGSKLSRILVLREKQFKKLYC